MDVKNKVKEFEGINRGLLHQQNKIKKLTRVQYKSFVKESLAPNQALEDDIQNKERLIAVFKKQYKELQKFRNEQSKRD